MLYIIVRRVDDIGIIEVEAVSLFQQEAFDLVLCDEAGELDPEKAEALLAGILPTLDTRPTAQIVVAGTPGEVRAGLLWTRLERLRAENVDYLDKPKKRR